MRTQFACLFLLLHALLSGCVKKETNWSLHNTAGCPVSTSSSELDRERTYLATLLALQARHYVIVKAQSPTYLEATRTSASNPAVARVRWLISVGPDASLNVDVPEEQRTMHRKVAGWYDELVAEVSSLQCRDPNWLRWEAQNRGLVPIGAYAGAESAGGEHAALPQGPAPQSPPPGAPLQVHPHAQRLAELDAERSQIHFVRPFAWAVVGGGFGVLGVTFAAYGAAFMFTDCDEDWSGYRDCTVRNTGRVLLPLGLGFGAAAATMLAITLPRGFSRLAKFRELGREIEIAARSNALARAGRGLPACGMEHRPARFVLRRVACACLLWLSMMGCVPHSSRPPVSSPQSDAKQPHQQHAAITPDPSPLQGALALNAKRVSELERERAAIHRRGPRIQAGLSALTIAASLGLVTYGAFATAGCDADGTLGNTAACPDRARDEAIYWLGFSGGCVGGMWLGLAMREIVWARRRTRTIDRELKLLRGFSPQLALPTRQGGVFALGLRWSAHY
ncbi:MAG: hypothetical protein QM778_02180 [Myxococcales bacterium]